MSVQTIKLFEDRKLHRRLVQSAQCRFFADHV